jgi:tRNA(Ser,Leu) C12 N-acetylase TAN1
MKIVTCYSGMEDITSKEVSGKKVAPGRVQFEKDVEIKSGIDVYELISKFKFKDLQDIIKNLEKINIPKEKTLSIECSRKGNHNFQSTTIIKELSKLLREKDILIDYKNNDKIIYIDIIDDLCFIGYLLKRNLNKREYRVKRHQMSIDCSLAYSLVQLLNPQKNKTLYVPNCKDAVIAIEAKLSSLNVSCFDTNPNNLRNARINSQMASADLDFKELNVCDYLLTYFPSPSKSVSNNLALRLLNKIKEIRFKKAVLISHSNWLKSNLDNYKIKERKISNKGNKFFIYLINT